MPSRSKVSWIDARLYSAPPRAAYLMQSDLRVNGSACESIRPAIPLAELHVASDRRSCGARQSDSARHDSSDDYERRSSPNSEPHANLPSLSCIGDGGSAFVPKIKSSMHDQEAELESVKAPA